MLLGWALSVRFRRVFMNAIQIQFLQTVFFLKGQTFCQHTIYKSYHVSYHMLQTCWSTLHSVKATWPRIQDQTWYASRKAGKKLVSEQLTVAQRPFSICLSLRVVVITSAWPLIGLISPLSLLCGQLTEPGAVIGCGLVEEEGFV